MKTDYIEQIVRHYLKKEGTQYALLINGTWGSGKTYFWEKKLKKLVVESKLKPMYVSLNGINSIDKLEQQIFIQLLPKLGKNQNDILNNLTTVSTNLANAASKFFFKSDLTDIAKGTSVKAFNFNKDCICFDDLERCKIPIDELFGYLSDFVEHKRLKCIFLADETKVKEQNENKNLKNGYDVIKEKIIGRVLNYKPELEVIIPILIQKFAGKKKLFKFLKSKEEIIINIFREQNIENLRLVNFFMENLATIYPHLNSTKDDYVVETILFSAIISIEFKKGKLISKEVDHFNDLNLIDANWYSRITSNYLTRKDKDKPQDKSYSETFYERYLTERVGHYHFYESLYQYILSGYFDNEKFEFELKSREPEVVQPHIEAFRKLLTYTFRELDDGEFTKLTKYVYDCAKKGKYWMYDYKQIANFYLYFCKENLISKKETTIKKDLLVGLNKAAKRKDIHQDIFNNLIHFKNEHPETKFIIDRITRLHKEIVDEGYNKFSMKVLSLIKDADKVEVTTFFNDNRLNKELLPFIKPTEFIDIIKKSSNEVVFLISEIIRERYDYQNPGEHMSGDIYFLENVKNLLQDYQKSKIKMGKLRKHNFDSLLENIGNSLKKIKNTLPN